VELFESFLTVAFVSVFGLAFFGVKDEDVKDKRRASRGWIRCTRRNPSAMSRATGSKTELT
jgi:hypothetical protein